MPLEIECLIALWMLVKETALTTLLIFVKGTGNSNSLCILETVVALSMWVSTEWVWLLIRTIQTRLSVENSAKGDDMSAKNPPEQRQQSAPVAV